MAAPKGNQYALGCTESGAPALFNTPQELQILIDNYFVYCDKNLKPYTMSGLALVLGVDRQTILNYGKKQEFFGTILKARQKVEAYAEERLFGNNVAGVIFNLKNNFGWQDKREVTLSPGMGTQVSEEEAQNIINRLPEA